MINTLKFSESLWRHNRLNIQFNYGLKINPSMKSASVNPWNYLDVKKGEINYSKGKHRTLKVEGMAVCLVQFYSFMSTTVSLYNISQESTEEGLFVINCHPNSIYNIILCNKFITSNIFGCICKEVNKNKIMKP